MSDFETLTVSKMGVTAAALLAKLYALSFKNMPEQIWDEGAFQELFKIPGTAGYVIEKSDQPIGFILIRKLHDEVEIITFCILPKWCNNGYATFLLEWVIKRLQQQAIKRVFLEVRENNRAAIRLYEKCSFEQIGRRKGYYNNHQGEKIDAIVMQLNLGT